MKNPFIIVTGAIILLFILGTKAFWPILVLTISIYLLIFVSNYLKKFETGDKDQVAKDFWKYSYDIRKIKKSIWVYLRHRQCGSRRCDSHQEESCEVYL